MGYDVKKWTKRVKYRSDISGYVYHLTKPVFDSDGNIIMSSLDRLLKIIQERKLIGSSTESGFIIGNRRAICFQDAPISGIVQNVLHEEVFREELGGKVRYNCMGLAFPKPYIFRNGGRPVFYEEKEKAKKILPPEEYWRIVDFNLSDKNNIVDWTHEREWRLPADEFHFDLKKAVVLLPNGGRYAEFIEKIPKEDLKELSGVIQSRLLAF